MKELFVAEISNVKGNPKVLKKIQKKTESFSEILKNLKKLRNSTDNLSVKEKGENSKAVKLNTKPVQKDVAKDIKEKTVSEELSKIDKKAPERFEDVQKNVLGKDVKKTFESLKEEIVASKHKDNVKSPVKEETKEKDQKDRAILDEKRPDEKLSGKGRNPDYLENSKSRSEKRPEKGVLKLNAADGKRELESGREKVEVKQEKRKLAPSLGKNQDDEAVKNRDPVVKNTPKEEFKGVSRPKIVKDRKEEKSRLYSKIVGEERIAKSEGKVENLGSSQVRNRCLQEREEFSDPRDTQKSSKELKLSKTSKGLVEDELHLRATGEKDKEMKERNRKTERSGKTELGRSLKMESKIELEGKNTPKDIHAEKEKDHLEKGYSEIRKSSEKNPRLGRDEIGKIFEKIKKVLKRDVFDGKRKISSDVKEDVVKGTTRASNPKISETFQKKSSRSISSREEKRFAYPHREDISKPNVLEKSKGMVNKEDVRESSGASAESADHVSQSVAFSSSKSKKLGFKSKTAHEKKLSSGVRENLKQSKRSSEIHSEVKGKERQISEEKTFGESFPGDSSTKVEESREFLKSGDLNPHNVVKIPLKEVKKDLHGKSGDHGRKENLKHQNFMNVEESFEKLENLSSYGGAVRGERVHFKKPLEKILSKKLSREVKSSSEVEILKEVSRVAEEKINVSETDGTSEKRSSRNKKVDVKKGESGDDPKSEVKMKVPNGSVNLAEFVGGLSKNGDLKLDEILKDTKKSVNIAKNLEVQSKKSVDAKSHDRKKILLENVRIEITVSKKVKDAYQSYEYDHRKFKDIFRKIQQVKEEINLMRFSESSHKSEGPRNVTSSPVSERVRIDEIIDRISRILESKKSQPKFVERARMDLEPPDLGKLEVEISKEDKSVALVFKVSSHHAKDLIEKKLDTLVHRLSSDGFNVEKIEVRVEKEERHEEDLTDHQENRGQREKDENEKKEKREEGEKK